MFARGCRRGLAFSLLLLAPHCLASYSIGTAPTFLWGSSSHLHTLSGGQAKQVSYQTIPTDRLVSEVLHGVSRSTGADKPEVLVVMLGVKLNVTELPALARGALAPLQALLQNAAASLALPYAQFEEGGGLYARLAAELAAAAPGGGLRLVELCAARGQDLTAVVDDALRSADAARPTVLLLCSPDDGGLEAEVALLARVEGAVRKSGRQYLALYTAKEVERAAGAGRARRLQESSFDDEQEYVCDAKCWAQVRALEAGILIIILLIAIAGGTLIMGAVDTPTRFQTPKREHGPGHLE